jgi:hypothetical protein
MLESYAAEVVFHAEQAELDRRIRRRLSISGRREPVTPQNDVAPMFATRVVGRRVRRAPQSWPRPIAVHTRVVTPGVVAC